MPAWADKQQSLTVPDCRRRILLGALLLGLAHPSIVAAADETPPLAVCQVQMKSPRTRVERQPGSPVNAATAAAAVVMTNYRRTPRGDWEIPKNVDAGDSTVRLMLMTPSGPLLLDVSLLIDDAGFRSIRERWIDSAFAGTSKKPEEQTSDELITAESVAADESSASQNKDVQDWQSNDAVTRLRNYVSQHASRPDADVSRNEARWLLSQWAPGPAFLELRPGFAGDRARLAPLWVALDTNTDGTLSSQEVSSATDRLRSLDTDEDEWVSEQELTDNVSPLADLWRSAQLLNVVSPTTNWNQLATVIRRNAALSSPGTLLLSDLNLTSFSKLNADHARQSMTLLPHLTIQIRFGTQSASKRSVRVSGARQEDLSLSVTSDVISVVLPGCVVELSAVQSSDSPSAATSQVAAGAVIDGSPLLRLADRNNDRRLSVREVSTVPGILQQADVNGDGALDLHELRVPIRLAFTHGPLVHDVLSRPVSAPEGRQLTDGPAAPDWFISMDRNNDAELTVTEFPGTQEQFNQLDADRDGRISVLEASRTEP